MIYDNAHMFVHIDCWRDMGNSQCWFFALWSRTSAQTFSRLISAAAVVHIFPVAVHWRLMSSLLTVVYSVIFLQHQCCGTEVMFCF